MRRLTINVAAAGCLSILFLDSVALSQDQTPEEKVAITKECNGTKSPEIIEDSITLKKTAYLRPRVLVVEASDGFTFCSESQVELNCTGGACWVSFNNGQYGHDPVGCSKVRIGSKLWSWCGALPDRLGRQMWMHLTDNIEVATQIASWPGRISNIRQTLKNVKRDKALVYDASLGK